MSSIVPNASNGYTLPSSFPLRRPSVQLLLTSLHERLAAREALEANFEALLAQGTTQTLAAIQANVAPVLTETINALRQVNLDIAAAQDAITGILAGQLSATNVTETAARRFVPAGPGALRRLLMSSASGLSWSDNIEIAHDGKVTFPQGVSVPWASITDAPQAFPPLGHVHDQAAIVGLAESLDNRVRVDTLARTKAAIVAKPAGSIVATVEGAWSALAPGGPINVAGNITLDFAAFIHQRFVVTGNIGLGHVNAYPGQSGVLEFVQDATGGRTWAFHAGGWAWAGAAPVLPSAPNARVLVSYFVLGDGRCFISLIGALSLS